MNLKTDSVVFEVVVHISTLPLMQFSYELLNISIKHRLYLIPQPYCLGLLTSTSFGVLPVKEQSLNLTFRSWLLIAHYLNTQDLTLCHLVYFFCFRHFHTCLHLLNLLRSRITMSQLYQLQGFPAIRVVLDSFFKSLPLHTYFYIC